MSVYRDVTAVAVETTNLYELSKAEFEKLIKQNANIYKKILHNTKQKLKFLRMHEKMHREQLYREGFLRM